MKFILLCVFLSVTVTAQTKTVTIKADSILGAFTLLNGVNCGPVGNTDGRDYTLQLQNLGISGIRTHDFYGPCDWSTIFPSWSAHPDSASSYNFRTSDTTINRIVRAGMSVLFRLGNSYRGNSSIALADPPGTIRDGGGNITHVADSNDFKKFAIICKRIVMHYNDAWAGGYRYNIRRWEIWNEPANPVQFWTGTYDQFRQMFAVVAKELKQYNNNLLVGGPAQAGNVTDPPFNDSLVAYCARVGAPIDFYSWHYYMSGTQVIRPYQMVSKAKQFRTMLDRYGYTATVQFCDEWNAGTNTGSISNYFRGGTYAAAALSYMNDVVTESYLYRGDYHPLGLFDSSGSPRRIVDGLVMWRHLTKNTSRILCSGTDTLGFTATASRSADGKNIRILVANFTAVTQQVSYQLTGVASLPSGTLTQLKYMLDTTNRFNRTDSVTITRSSTITLSQSLAPYTTQLIEYRIDNSTDIADNAHIIDSYQLLQNYPNPFNPSTTLSYVLPEAAHIKLTVCNTLGSQVAIADLGYRSQGTHSVSFDASTLGSGLYLYTLSTPGITITKKMIVLK